MIGYDLGDLNFLVLSISPLAGPSFQIQTSPRKKKSFFVYAGPN